MVVKLESMDNTTLHSVLTPVDIHDISVQIQDSFQIIYVTCLSVSIQPSSVTLVV